ncbi:MAG: hypothetical protein A3F11_01280 [Gammaproteobacteria bacterium RIFCSPHIGHO2_12_FULL_37_14]|nr:MAG: hypothetical protein A3F11_01280 [Gammaproteobacteria bacterium RIFCSPHIGHO2_12_FULL_37_14]
MTRGSYGGIGDEVFDEAAWKKRWSDLKEERSAAINHSLPTNEIEKNMIAHLAHRQVTESCLLSIFNAILVSSGLNKEMQFAVLKSPACTEQVKRQLLADKYVDFDVVKSIVSSAIETATLNAAEALLTPNEEGYTRFENARYCTKESMKVIHRKKSEFFVPGAREMLNEALEIERKASKNSDPSGPFSRKSSSDEEKTIALNVLAKATVETNLLDLIEVVAKSSDELNKLKKSGKNSDGLVCSRLQTVIKRFKNVDIEVLKCAVLEKISDVIEAKIKSIKADDIKAKWRASFHRELEGIKDPIKLDEFLRERFTATKGEHKGELLPQIKNICEILEKLNAFKNGEAPRNSSQQTLR